MTDMIEKMARAAYEWTWRNDERSEPEEWPHWDSAPQLVRDEWIGQQLAALSALEEPSEAMIEAGDKSLTWGIVPNDELRAAFTAMIKAAKGEE